MNILFVGKPGAGKGTIIQKLGYDNFVHLSTGDLLRTEIAKGTELGKEIDQLLKEGKFATDEVIIKMVGDFISENKDKNIIFDGFPRNIAQVKTCLENNILFDKIINLQIDDELIIDRVVNRRVHVASGRVYNLKTMPPKNEGLDDVTGEKLTHRNDDREEILLKRLETYKKVTEPILEYLEFNNMKVTVVDASKDLAEQVSFIKEKLENIKVKNKLKI